MTKYFGTDGYRGKANEGLNADDAFAVGRYLGYYYGKNGRRKIVIGKDTRLSSDMLENALAAGISSEGCDAYLLGYCPTPMVCYLTRTEDFECGAMISASHNPFYDNGIKIFSKEGIKLPSEIEDLIEDYLDHKVAIEYAKEENIGRIVRYDDGMEHYLDWVEKEFPTDLAGFKLAVDCANGSASFTAERALKKLGATVTMSNDQPDGTNINNGCGSTHPDKFRKFVQAGDFDLGLTFDGDADRQILIAPDGELIDGDTVLYICGKYYRDVNRLKGNTIVTTVMANLGLWKAMERENIAVEKTDVGDKNVYEMMCRKDYVVGGEQSGHIIFKYHETTGDGLVTALAILKIMKVTGKGVIELRNGLKIYPQVLKNVKVSDKTKVMDDPEVQKAVEQAENSLNGDGRILVRPSGTEPLLRVMAEAGTDELCQKAVDTVADVIAEKYGI